MEWAAVVSGLLTIAALLIRAWINRDKSDDTNKSIQQGRQDINSGNVAAVNDRVDRLLTKSGDTVRKSDSPVTAERISAVLGVADAGRGDGQDTGNR